MANFIHSMSRFDNKPHDTLLKTLSQNLGLPENLVFYQKNIVVEFFSGSDEAPKGAKNLLFRFCWLIIFCSSEEPLATNVLVEFRVITSFKLLPMALSGKVKGIFLNI